MYDDTVRYATAANASLATGSMFAPKIEPEVVFKLSRPLSADGEGTLSADQVLRSTEWIAIGFEIIDCVFPDWKFQAADFVASYGLHAALVVGRPLTVHPAAISQLVEQLPKFGVHLSRNGEQVAEGSGRNALRSPALCVAELAGALARTRGAVPLAAGDLVSTGTLTESQRINAGEVWRVDVDELDLAPLTLTIE
jgi:2-oxo-3-hexenedioate decarboxylase